MTVKKVATLSMVILIAISLMLAGCGQNAANNNQAPANQPAENQPAENQPAENKEPETKGIKVGMVTDVGGVNDNSFNQSAWEGLQRFKADTRSEVDYLQSQGDADYVPNLNQFARNGWDLTWGIGFMMGDAMKEVADQNPNANFGIIDAVVEAPNVVSTTFKEQEGSFLVGVVAGLMTDSNKIGFVGGMEIPVITRFEVGFVAGVKAVNPDAQVIINYTGAFDAPDQGKAAAATIYDDGADIIFHAAGSTGDGVFNEASERLKNGKKVWVIGVDKDQAQTFGHDVTLTSMMKYVDEAVYIMSNSLLEGNFPGGEIRSLGLKENGVGLPKDNPNVPADILAQVDDYSAQIISGEIVVPDTK
jgi:basic membrane protein A